MSTSIKTGGARIAFAHQLRGVAALCVVWLHLGISYWVGKGYVLGKLGLPANMPVSTLPWWAVASHQVQTLGTDRIFFDFGAFGVALFFLISGFVIPMSLNQLGPIRFLMARVVRIYPVYWVSLLLWPLAWQGLDYLYGSTIPQLSKLEWWAHFFMVGDWLGYPSVDLVSWTLQIELRFYAVVALFYSSVRHLQVRGIYVFWVTTLTVGGLKYGLLRSGGWQPLGPNGLFVLNQNLIQMAFVGFIFSGYVLYLFWRKLLSARHLVLYLVVGQLAFVLLMQFCGIKGGALRLIVVNQVWALLVFVAAMCGNLFKGGRVLDFFARISYPIYMVHLIVGWATLVVLNKAGCPDAVALLLAFGCVILMAWGLHRAVEQPSLRWLGRLKQRSVLSLNEATAPTTAAAASGLPPTPAHRRPSR